MELTRKPRLSRGGLAMGNLLATRRGTFVIAFACAVAAAIVIMLALSNYRKSVSTAAQQDTVLVANGLMLLGAEVLRRRDERRAAPATDDREAQERAYHSARELSFRAQRSRSRLSRIICSKT